MKSPKKKGSVKKTTSKEKRVQKIGSVPFNFSDNAKLYIEDRKIYIME